MNGEQASESEPTQLLHNDRLIIGNNHVFRVVDAFAPAAPEEGAPVYDWRFAIEEMHKKKMAALNAQEQKRREEAEREKAAMAEKVKELERSVAEEKRKLEEANDQEKVVLMQKQKELEERLAKQMEETAMLLKKREEEERQDDLLQEHLLRTIPLVSEANSIGRELQKNIVFNLKVMSGEA